MDRPIGRGNVQVSFLDVFIMDPLYEVIILFSEINKSGKSYAKENKISHVAQDSKKESNTGTSVLHFRKDVCSLFCMSFSP